MKKLVFWGIVCVASSVFADEHVFRFGTDGKLTFLQVADIQDCGNIAPRTIAVISNACVRFKPAFMLLTGDNIDEPANAHGVFEKSISPFTDLARNVRVPFAVTFGNHDYRNVSATRYNGDEQYAIFKQFGGEWFIDHDVTELSGSGNGVIPIYGVAAVASEMPLVNIFLMDSHQYASTNYTQLHYHDGVYSDQIAWYERVSGKTPCLWFQHIPVAEMSNLLITVPAGTAGAVKFRDNKYYVVNPALASGLLREPVCSCDDTAYIDAKHTYDGRTIYQSWLKMGNMRGAFFGHDHLNTFMGTDPNGITMGYCKACTLHVYSDKDPGVRVFTLHTDGSYETDTVSERYPEGLKKATPPIKLKAAAQNSIYWRTLLEKETNICWDWPAAAQSAVLDIRGGRSSVTKVFSTAVSNYVWAVPVPATERDEDVFSMSLSFFDATNGTGNCISASEVSGIGRVRGTSGASARLLGKGSSSTVWNNVPGPRTVLPVILGMSALSINGSARAFAPPPSWFLLGPMADNELCALSFQTGSGDYDAILKTIYEQFTVLVK